MNQVPHQVFCQGVPVLETDVTGVANVRHAFWLFFFEYQKYPYANLRWFNSVIKNYTKNYRPNTNVKNYLISHNSAVKVFKTRMHSSGMHTGRSLTVCWSLLPGGSPWQGGLFGRRSPWQGGLPGRGVSPWQEGWYPNMH